MTVEQPHAAHGDEGHGHAGGSPFTQHHYDDAQHQFDSGKFGIWLFLAQEVLFFSALFVAYTLYRYHHPEIYSYAHKYLDVKYGAINTAVLIFSSLTAAWAVRAAQLAQRRLLIACLALTLMCAMTFLVIKYIEYTHKVHEHLLFGERFDPCVSSGEVPLVNRGNECPGHQSSVVWNYSRDAVDGGVVKHGTPEYGCFPEIALDTDPRRSGLQLACTVRETKLEAERDEAGNPIANTRTGNWVLVEEKTHKRVVNPPEKAKAELFEKVAKLDDKKVPDAEKQAIRKQLAEEELVTKQCPAPTVHHEGAEHAEHDTAGFPCWRAAAQPAVCRSGWFYTMRCTGGPKIASAPAELAVAKKELVVAKAAAAKVKPALDQAKKALEAAKASSNPNALKAAQDDVAELSKPEAEVARLDKVIKDLDALVELGTSTCSPTGETYSPSIAFMDKTACTDGKAKQNKQLKNLSEEEKKTLPTAPVGGPSPGVDPGAVSATTWTMTDCVHSNQVGFLVEHGDHAERGEEVLAVASCAGPPAVLPTIDPVSEHEQQIQLGTKAIDPAHEVTAHEEHELESLGPPPDHTNMFFTIYFAMTGLHGIHVLFGVFVFIWLLIRAIKGQFTPDYFGPVDFAALYWHIVDLIWIFLFPLLYLIH